MAGRRATLEATIGQWPVQVVDYGEDREDRARQVHVVNLCFEAEGLAPGQPSTPEETLELGFFGADQLPGPFVPIHEIRIRDGLSGRIEAVVR